MVLLASCGGGGTGTFTAATPLASVCALLTPVDVAAIFPDAISGGEYPIIDTVNIWGSECHWHPSQAYLPTLALTVYGAKTPPGLTGLVPPSDPGTVSTLVTGIGTAARYWEQVSLGNGLWALEGSWTVNLAASYFTTPLTEAQLRPLVARALGELE